MPTAKIKEIEFDSNSFPLFTRAESTNYLFGANNVWVSDIWGFWDYLIRKPKGKIKKPEKKYTFLYSLLEQAKYFFMAAESAPIKSQPLLYYYSFMNLAKIVLNISVDDSEAIWRDKKYIHGLSESTGTQSSLNDSTVSCIDNPKRASVAQLFMKTMGDTISNDVFNVKELLSSCLGIHRAYAETYSVKETFYRIDDIRIFEQGRTFSFEAVIHDCNQDNIAEIQRIYPQITDIDINGNHSGIYTWKEGLNKPKSEYYTKKDLNDLADLMRNKGVWGISNGQDMSLYISTSPIRLSTVSIIYALMFFFGSITRYRPYVFDELLSDKNKWLMSEFLKTQPKQFLYLVTSRVLGRNIRQSWMTKM